MRFLRLFPVVLALLTLASVAAVGVPDDKAHPDLNQLMTNKVKWNYALMPAFDEAARKHDVPLPLLLALAYFGSAFENRGDAPTIEGGYGIMALRENQLGGDSLSQAVTLAKVPKGELKVHARQSIKAAAIVLDHYAKKMGIDRSQGLQAWLDVVIGYAGLDQEFSRMFAMEVYEKLLAGLDWTNSAGERFYFPPQDIGDIDLSSLEPVSVTRISPDSLAQVAPTSVEQQEAASSPAATLAPTGPPPILGAGYSGATWYPAASCNYNAYYTAKDTIVCHTIEGSAAGALSWFRNCNADVSAHYVVSEAGGVWQCVDENYRAWHVGCMNSRSIGIEHEGYAGSSSHPHSLYNASGLLCRDICNRWGIAKAHRTCPPGILGHNDANNCVCDGTHWDPGPGWDWAYFIQQVNGAPPPPTWSASYRAQSYPASMTAGTTAVAWVEYTNNGTGHWTHGDTRLGTSSPQDRSSPFFNAGNWIGANRPTDVDQTDVAQGQVGRFTFILKAPSTPGTYVEKYRLVQEGVTWFGSEITWTITVTAATGNITGTVRNAANGQAIGGATVSISGGPSTTANSSGVYTFSGITVGTYTLTATAGGFNPSSAGVAVNSGATTTHDFSLTPVDATPPGAPTGLTATAVSPSQINLNWTAATDNVGVTGYRVYRGGVQIGTTTGTSFQNNGLAANTSYSFYVKAFDAANNLSEASNTASATTYPGAVPIFEDGFANTNYWQAIIQSPMPGAYTPVLVSDKNHGTFSGGSSLKSLSSADPNQGCLIGHTFDPAFGAAKFETYFFDGTGMDYSGRFEGTIDGWASYPSAYATLTSVGGGVSGNCLQASDGGWTSGCYKEITNGFTAGENYSMSMWAKWPPPPAGKSYTTAPRCFVRFLDGAGVEIRTDYAANINTDSNWHQYSVSGAIPAGTVRIWIGHWGVLGASQTYLYFADSVAFSSRSVNPVNNNSRQGLQVRCHDNNGGVKAIYYVGCYTISGDTNSPKNYSVGYYKVCGTGCTGWYWTGNVMQRTSGWHKFTLDFLPYTGSGDVKAYIDGTLVATLDRTLDTQTYGLSMVAYGYHYRVNQESWYDDAAMYATQPYPSPTIGVPQALGPTSIRWNFTDNSNNEIGFKILDEASQVRGTAGVLNGTGSGGYIDEGGLAPNTPYTRFLRACNGSLDSFNSATATRWTLSAPPSTASIDCDRAVSTWYGTPQFRFAAVDGFGQGTVSGYQYVWDQSPIYSFVGGEPTWSSGDLLMEASAEGDWYLHVRGLNGEGTVNGTLDLGPYRFDGTPPLNPTSAVETHGAETGVWQATVSDPSFTWSGASDALSGVASYLVYFGTDETGSSDTEVTSPGCTPSVPGSGTYFLRVCAKDAAGVPADEWATLFVFKYDSTAPDTPTVADDGPYSGSATRLHATWHAVDAESDVVEYQYAVGTSAGASDTLDWTTAGILEDGMIPIPAPGLTAGQTYYISVKAKNGAGTWSNVGSSDGIALAADAVTIGDARKLIDTTPVALSDKVVTASFPASYYIEETDRSSGILVIGHAPAAGSIVTVGGILGVNAAGERAIADPATILEVAADPNNIPKPLFLTGNWLGGGNLNTYTQGVTDHPGTYNVGLLVQVAGIVQTPTEHEFLVNDGSSAGPVKVIAPDFNVSAIITAGDPVAVTGISTLEFDGLVRRPFIRLRGPADIARKN